MYHTNRTDRHPAATFDKFERFENWLRSNGAKFDQVCSDIVLFVCLLSSIHSLTFREQLELRSYEEPPKKSVGEEKKDIWIEDDDEPEMRGVHAKSRIAAHTIVTQIPRQCLITVEMGQETPIGRQILQSQLDLE